MPPMRYLGLTTALVLVLACSAPAQQAPQPTPSGGPGVAATVGDRTITMQEVDERWRQANPAEHAQAMQAMYEGRRNALDGIIADMLIEAAATSAGQSVEEFTQEETAKRAKPVTDGDVVSFFQANQSQMQGRGLAAMGPLIRRFLEEQQQAAARATLVSELRKAGPAVKLSFDPPRREVAIAADDASQGRVDAPVTIVEFSDFQCPFCLQLMPTLKRIRETYGDRVRLVWKDFPLTNIHPQAFQAAEAGNCAREQGKFWEYHDRLFANQQALMPEQLKQHAADAGLDAAQFNQCLDTEKYGGRVQEHVGVGAELGVNSTPAVFINGRQVTGAQPYETFTAVIDEELERLNVR